eukprot:jgi/Mesen1/3149/ME000184S02214
MMALTPNCILQEAEAVSLFLNGGLGGGVPDPPEDDGQKGDEHAARWPKAETEALIALRSAMDPSFRQTGHKGPLWEEISRQMVAQGYARSWRKCREKFDNLWKYYKKNREGVARRRDGKSYQFFAQLHAMCAALDGMGLEMGVVQQQQQPGGPEGAGREQRSSGKKRKLQPGEGLAGAGPGLGQGPGPRGGNGGGSDVRAGQLEAHFRKFLEQQEAAQRRFLEAMERREDERAAREDAWRKQELARAAQEAQDRQLEATRAAARDAALVALLQKLAGQCPLTPPPGGGGGSGGRGTGGARARAAGLGAPGTGAASRTTTRGLGFHSAANPDAVLRAGAAAGARVVDGSRGRGGGGAAPTRGGLLERWPKAEVMALIRLRVELEARFQAPGNKAHLWEQVAVGMGCAGFARRSPKRCREKWENITKYFWKAKGRARAGGGSARPRREDGKACPYYARLDSLYQQGRLTAKHADAAAAADASADAPAAGGSAGAAGAPSVPLLLEGLGPGPGPGPAQAGAQMQTQTLGEEQQQAREGAVLQREQQQEDQEQQEQQEHATIGSSSGVENDPAAQASAMEAEELLLQASLLHHLKEAPEPVPATIMDPQPAPGADARTHSLTHVHSHAQQAQAQAQTHAQGQAHAFDHGNSGQHLACSPPSHVDEVVAGMSLQLVESGQLLLSQEEEEEGHEHEHGLMGESQQAAQVAAQHNSSTQRMLGMYIRGTPVAAGAQLEGDGGTGVPSGRNEDSHHVS